VYTLDGHQTDQFLYISNAAHDHGFLKRFYRKYRDIYKCWCPNGCYGFPPDDECWQYQGSEPTNEVEEN